ncbi:activity-regulated cytoskeleton associated protein 2-like [Eurosta solidaginis]|uniref:activity-regulated cytoskeleton associated protein 2-like n=1 Tax=Eurosta solidaginis TaxID=178769 RepID=UPI003530BB1A
MPTLTEEQFAKFLQSVVQVNERPGSFSRCTARYKGERSSAKVEEFTAAILTYKTFEKVRDGDAISGMPMVLEGDAAEWRRGVKSEAQSFSDVICMLREAFSHPKQSWRIYVEIFELKQQKNEPTDTFIRKKRAIFSQLTKEPAEADQRDLLFGLLHMQIRDKVTRDKVNNYNELLKEAREVELYLQERKIPSANTEESEKPVGGPVRCGFCRKKGHSTEEYLKKKNAKAQETHTEKLDQAQSLKPKYACYGCNAPGVTRANCPNCIKSEVVVKPNSVSFNSLNVTIGRDIPVVNIEMFGVPGQVYFDSGVRTSVASVNLKRVMDYKGYIFKKVGVRLHSPTADPRLKND